MEAPDEWVEAAEERNISLTEYTKRMVRAGRRQFGYDYQPSETPAEPKTLKLDETGGSDIEPTLKAWILTNLSTDDPLDTDDLAGLLEDDILDLAGELIDEGKAEYRPEKGGYLKIPDDE